jgi:plastocyanin
MNIEKFISRKNKIILAIASLAIFGAGCGTQKTDATGKPGETVPAAESKSIENGSNAFRAELKTVPETIEAGKETTLVFNVKDGKGSTVKDLQIVHEKPMHLLIASKDLAEFYHIHPEPQADGTYTVAHTFPNGGEFRLYADFTPQNAKQVVEQIDIKVSGNERAKIPLTADAKFEKTVDGLRVAMNPDGEIKAGEELMLNFQMFDAKTNQPGTDLQNYLGELAHFVIISEDMKDFVHAHPMSKSDHNSAKTGDHNADGHTHGADSAEKKSASEVSAHTAFPRAGLYKVWAQFQRNDQIITVPFTVNVKENAQKTEIRAAKIPTGATKITVSKNGYEPSAISVKKGEAVKLAFYRADAENCGGELIFPKLNVTKKLAVGETVLVEFTPEEAGEIAFSCGMNMMKGKVLVQ